MGVREPSQLRAGPVGLGNCLVTAGGVSGEPAPALIFGIHNKTQGQKDARKQ